MKLADKTCNIHDMADSPPAHWTLDRRREYVDWAERVVEGLPEHNEPLKRLFDARVVNVAPDTKTVGRRLLTRLDRRLFGLGLAQFGIELADVVFTLR